MDDFKQTEGEQLTMQDVREKIDTHCSVRHKVPRKTFEVKSNRIGKGAVGFVYETCEQADCTYVAKIIEKHWSFNKASLEKESRIQMIAAGHGLAPTIHEIWNCKNNAMLIMDRITGITLQAFLKDPTKDDSTKTRIIKKVSDAIENLHLIGIAHGDLHLENIMVKEDESIIFIDFGKSEYYGNPITDIFFGGPDYSKLREDLIQTFPYTNKKWLNQEVLVFKEQ